MYINKPNIGPSPGTKFRTGPNKTQVPGPITLGPGPQVHSKRLTGPRTKTGPGLT